MTERKKECSAFCPKCGADLYFKDGVCTCKANDCSYSCDKCKTEQDKVRYEED